VIDLGEKQRLFYRQEDSFTKLELRRSSVAAGCLEGKR
jgi:hypothetical protein